MIFFTDRQFTTLAVASYDSSEGVRVIDDEMTSSVETGTSLLVLTISKTVDTEKITEGCMVITTDFRGRQVVFEIMEVEETRTQKRLIAQDAGLDLINEDNLGFSLKAKKLTDYFTATVGTDSGWELGLNESGGATRTGEWTDIATQTKRLLQVANLFGLEISYSFKFDGNQLLKKYVNFHKRIGVSKGARLEVGKELDGIKRTASIVNLATGVKPVAEPIEEEVTVVNTVTEKAQPAVVVNTQLDQFLDWFKARKGKVRYSMGARMGPNSYDCSSAVFFAAKNAGLVPKNHVIGSTETLFSLKGKYLDEINRSQIKPGDIFVAGVQGQSAGAFGHTGAVISSTQIIHCNASDNGINITPISGRTGSPVRWFRWRNVTPTTTNGAYWTNSDLTRHDLGKGLNGITAQQINNWIKGSSPSSPFNGLGAVFIEAQKQSGLDSRYILGHAALESAWGKSSIATRYHNYFGIGAFDNNPENAKNYSHANIKEGIVNGARWIKDNYYSKGQKTLFTMRHNNGTHEYATDPDWHSKIAAVMRNSEKYTKASQPMDTTKVTTSTTTVEKKLDLVGYKYDDGRYYVDKDGSILDRQAGQLWTRYKTDGKPSYIIRAYESQAKTQKALLDASLNWLKKHNEPEISYDVPIKHLPDNVDIGDTVRVVDHDFNPPLYLEARLIEVTYSRKRNKRNKGTFSNFVVKESGISEQALELKANQPTVAITSSNGNTFKDGIIDTVLTATVFIGGVNVTPQVEAYEWFKANGVKLESVTNACEITADDIEGTERIICHALDGDGIVVAVGDISIKDLTIGVYKMPPPSGKEKVGDILFEQTGETTVLKVWDGGKWEPKLDSEKLNTVNKEFTEVYKPKIEEMDITIEESRKKADDALASAGVAVSISDAAKANAASAASLAEEAKTQSKETADQVSTMITDYAKTSDLKGMVTETTLATKGYQTATQVGTTLTDYLKTTDLNGKLKETINYQNIEATTNMFTRVIGSTDNAIKENIARIVLTDSAYVTEISNSDLIARIAGSRLINDDPLFEKGNDGFDVYNDSNNGAVTITRQNENGGTQPNGAYRLRVETSGDASPGAGGVFKQGLNARVNAEFVVRITALVPIGKTLQIGYNSLGTGASVKALTDTKGTGGWQEYAWYYKCGSSGTFSTFGHLYIVEPGNVTWYISKYEAYDLGQSYNTRVTQLAESWEAKLNDGDNLIASINLSKKGVKIDGALTHITGKTIIDYGVIKDGHIESLTADKIKVGTLDAAKVNVTNLDVDKLTGNRAGFVKVWLQGALTRSVIEADRIRIEDAAKSAYVEINSNQELRTRGANGLGAVLANSSLSFTDTNRNTVGYLGSINASGDLGVRISKGKAFKIIRDSDTTGGTPAQYHTVVSGESWRSITDKYLGGSVSVYVLADMNNTTPTRYLQPNERIIVKEAIPGNASGYETFINMGTSTGGQSRLYLPQYTVFEGGTNISSDRRLKKNIADTPIKALDIIKPLQFKTFDFKKGNRHVKLGLIAQDAGELKMVEDDKYYIDLELSVMTALKGVQELEKRLAKLEKG